MKNRAVYIYTYIYFYTFYLLNKTVYNLLLTSLKMIKSLAQTEIANQARARYTVTNRPTNHPPKSTQDTPMANSITVPR